MEEKQIVKVAQLSDNLTRLQGTGRNHWSGYVLIEPLFGEAREFHRLIRYHLKRLLNVNTEAVMLAVGNNLKELIILLCLPQPRRI